MKLQNLEELTFDDQMGAGKAGLQLTYSTLWHLTVGGGTAQRVKGALAPRIYYPRVVLWLDVSKWQGEINFITMRDSGVHGVIIKCGQGTAKDPKFDQNWINAKEAGLPRGTYWFYDSRVSPEEQAKRWWDWIKHDPGELMHFADYEENYGGAYSGWQNFKRFLKEFQRLSGLPNNRIGIYTGYYYWIAHSPTSATELAYFGQFPLWLAWYAEDFSNVIIPKPWTIAYMIAWQYGTPANGIMRGCQSLEVDENNEGDVSVEAYKARFNLNGNGGTVATKYGTATGNITIRTGPGTSFPQVVIGGVPQYVYSGDSLEWTEESSGFAHLSKITREGQNIAILQPSWCGMQYIRVEAGPPVPPVTADTITVTVTELGLQADRTEPITVTVSKAGYTSDPASVTITLRPT